MSAARASISLGFTFRTLRSESASLFSWMVWMVIFHSFRRSRCLRPAALTRWRSAGWGGGSKIDGSGAGGATREAPSRVSAPEQAELVEQIGRASCGERVCQSLSISVVAVSLKKKKKKTYNSNKN